MSLRNLLYMGKELNPGSMIDIFFITWRVLFDPKLTHREDRKKQIKQPGWFYDEAKNRNRLNSSFSSLEKNSGYFLGVETRWQPVIYYLLLWVPFLTIDVTSFIYYITVWCTSLDANMTDATGPTIIFLEASLYSLWPWLSESRIFVIYHLVSQPDG